MCNRSAPSSSTPHPSEQNVSVPLQVIDIVLRDVAQAHLSLHALAALLRGESAPDLHGVAYLLEYMEEALQRSDDLISPYMTARNRGHAA